jgi:hypothetical protein
MAEDRRSQQSTRDAGRRRFEAGFTYLALMILVATGNVV